MFRKLKLIAIGAAFMAASAIAGWIASGDAQGFLGIFQNGIPTGPSIYGVVDPTSGFYFGPTGGGVGVSRHFWGGSTATNNIPVATVCATPAFVAGYTDTNGVVACTGGTAITLTFGTAFRAQPSCFLEEQGGAVVPTYTVTATAITVATMVASTNYSYFCMGVSGG
jgi:hypothetical protein